MRATSTSSARSDEHSLLVAAAMESGLTAVSEDLIRENAAARPSFDTYTTRPG